MLVFFAGDPYGGFRSAQRKTLAYKRSHFSEPYGFVRRKHTAKRIGVLPILFAGDPYGTRTHVTTVKGWCLNRLTNGPYIYYGIFVVYRLLVTRSGLEPMLPP